MHVAHLFVGRTRHLHARIVGHLFQSVDHELHASRDMSLELCRFVADAVATRQAPDVVVFRHEATTRELQWAIIREIDGPSLRVDGLPAREDGVNLGEMEEVDWIVGWFVGAHLPTDKAADIDVNEHLEKLVELGKVFGWESEKVLLDDCPTREHLHAVVSLQAPSSDNLKLAELERPVFNTAVLGPCRVSETAVWVPYRRQVRTHGESGPVPVRNGDTTVNLLKKVLVLEQEETVPGEELADGGVSALGQSSDRIRVLVHQGLVSRLISLVSCYCDDRLRVPLSVGDREGGKVSSDAAAVDEGPSSARAPSLTGVIHCCSLSAGWGGESQ